MKKISIVLLTLFIGISVNAQKIKIKKDVIYKDKAEIGRVEKTAARSLADGVKIFGLNDELIMTISTSHYYYNNPLYTNVNWYNIKFGDTNKELMLFDKNLSSGSIKYVLNRLMNNFEFNIDGTVIKNQDEIISKNDYTETFIADTTKIREEEAMNMGFLKDNEILRDKSKSVKFINNGDGTFNIVQDNTVIGSFYKKEKMSSGNLVSTTYWFIEKFYEPKGVDNITEYYAATVTINNSTTPAKSCDVFTFADKKTLKVTIKNPAHPENEILASLIVEGYL
jgi:hypothetical protein